MQGTQNLPSPVSDIGAPLEKFRHTDQILTRQGVHFYIYQIQNTSSRIHIKTILHFNIWYFKT